MPLRYVVVNHGGLDGRHLAGLGQPCEVLERVEYDMLRPDCQPRENFGLVLGAEVRPVLAARVLVRSGRKLPFHLPGIFLGHAPAGADPLGLPLAVGIVPADGPRAFVRPELLFLLQVLKKPCVHGL